ncbi:MAG: hypothetical protein FWG31_02950 [Oscillospiraceae bacterium]|nr:hypothetical protein [Oscillospiraceae bacterium]
MSNEVGRHKKFVHECERPVEVHEEIGIAVPVTVRAEAEVKDVKIRCNGCEVHEGGNCPGRPHAVSKFVVSQRIELDIPIEFECEVDVGEGHINYDVLEDNCGCHGRERENGEEDKGYRYYKK